MLRKGLELSEGAQASGVAPGLDTATRYTGWFYEGTMMMINEA